MAAHVRSLIFAFVLFVLAGVGAAARLPVALFPQISFPRVVVAVDAGERAADQMEIQVTRPLEQALRAVRGVSGIRSTTSRGSADISLSFPWGHDMGAATLETQAALSSSQGDLPPGTRFVVRRMDPTVFPIFGLALTSTGRSPAALRQFAELRLRPLILATPGVAAVEVLGGATAEYHVVVDPARLAAFGLSADDIAKALASANVVQTLGRLEDRHRLYLTILDNRLTTADDLRAVVLKGGQSAAAGLVTLGQVADVAAGAAPGWIRVTAQGRDAVLINVRQTPAADSVAMVKAVKRRLADAASQTPRDIHTVVYYNQSELVSAAASGVRDAILIGAVLAGLVLFLFLRSLRLMAICALMLPAVLASSCLLLALLGMSFNMMTLGGMAAAVGLVVDDAVVMLEHQMRRLQEAQAECLAPDGVRDRVLTAAGEMQRALVGSTFATLVVFAPLAFLGGVTGGFFKALAVTMAAALIISLVFVLLIVPLLSRRWLRLKDVEAAEKSQAMMRRLGAGYGAAIRRTLARPVLTVIVAAAVFAAAGALAYTQLGSGFLPPIDEGGFVLDYKAHPGAALSDTDALLRRAEAIIRANPNVDSYSRRTGVQLGLGLTEADEGDFFIHLKPPPRAGIETVMADIRRQVQARVPGLDIETAQLMEDAIGDLTAVPQPIEIKLFGPDPAGLRRAASEIAPAIGKIPGVVEVVDGLRPTGDAVVLKVNEAAAEIEGLDPATIAAQVQGDLAGAVATQIAHGEMQLDVRVWTPPALRDRVDALGSLQLRAADGHSVPLSRVAAVSVQGGQQQITRENLQPFVGVTARLEHRDLGSAMVRVKEIVARLSLPAGVRVEYGGLYAEQQKSFADLAVVFGSALLLVIGLLLYLFERVGVAAAIVAVVLMAAACVFVGLWITGTELNISALMGLTMIVGIVTELAIFYAAEIEAPEDGGVEARRASLARAGHARLRPILMSAVIAILALSPLALGLGEGAGMQKPLAIAIITGLIAGAPLVLIVLPAALLALDRRRDGALAPRR
ncbi:MAG: efflux RND transporter permease subunit [Caulobacteraceae bacterium]